MINFEVRLYDSIGSTNDEARRLAEAGAAHGTVIVARQQTAGRGRQGRRWFSPPGNLYLSVVLCFDLPELRMPELGFVAALSIADVVETLAPCRAMLKWPNDVQVGGAKLSGILLERAGPVVVAGIGINVQEVPMDTSYPATCLSRVAGTVVTVDAACTALLDALAHRLCQWEAEGFGAVRAAWLERAHPPGTWMNVTIGVQRTSGRFVGLSENGALLLETANGHLQLVAGDVSVGVAP